MKNLGLCLIILSFLVFSNLNNNTILTTTNTSNETESQNYNSNITNNEANNETSSKSLYDLIDTTKIVKEINEETVTPEGLTYTITNNNDISYYYYKPYTIEKENNGIWDVIMEYPAAGIEETENGYVSAHSQETVTVDRKRFCGSLEPGNYRLKLILNVNTGVGEYFIYSYLEFTID